MKDYVIVANGNFLVKEIIKEVIQNKAIIALDGAANKLMRLGIKPHVILGDFDSINPSFIQFTDINTIHVNDQNKTDLIKAIHYCDVQGAQSISIICATGGRLDHHEGAIRALRTEYKKNRIIQIHTEQQTLRYVKDEVIVIRGNMGDKCGIVAFPKGTLSSQGLAYDVENYELNFGFSDSICNALTHPNAIISVTGEALIIMPPQLSSQRDFMNKTEIERLEMQLRDAKECEE